LPNGLPKAGKAGFAGQLPTNFHSCRENDAGARTEKGRSFFSTPIGKQILSDFLRKVLKNLLLDSVCGIRKGKESSTRKSRKILYFPIRNTGFIPFTFETGRNTLEIMRQYPHVTNVILLSGMGAVAPTALQPMGCKEPCPDEFLDLSPASRHPISPLFYSHRNIDSLPIRSSKLFFF
jgi:hypothetical protein